jgi:hypothetical protein
MHIIGVSFKQNTVYSLSRLFFVLSHYEITAILVTKLYSFFKLISQNQDQMRERDLI